MVEPHSHHTRQSDNSVARLPARELGGVDLDLARPMYWVPRQPLVEEVLIPAFAQASAAECMVGYFSSGSLAELAPGLATYIHNANTSFRLIINPVLTEDDQRALEAGTRSPEEIATQLFHDGLVGETDLQKHTLLCLSYLVATRRIEIKVALMRDAIWHPKVWLFHLDKGLLTASGSSNMTRSGIRKNTEQVVVSKAWADPNQRFVAESFMDEFDRAWRNRSDDYIVLDLPDAVRRKILVDYPAERAPTEGEFLDLYKRAVSGDLRRDRPIGETSYNDRSAKTFAVPGWLKYDDGPFAHQGKAVRAFVEAGFRGVLEMATGSGKTLTSMIAAVRLYERSKPLLVVVAAPYAPLIEQWCDEVAQFGIPAQNMTTLGGAAARGAALKAIGRSFRHRKSDVEIVVVSHDTLCAEDFKRSIAALECHRMLIADEAHNLGRANFVSDPPTFFESRLGLSATPIRQYDQEGTDALFAFFGPVVFSFTLKEAIGVCLVPYDYFVHPVRLLGDEMDRWSEITAKIRQNAWRNSDSGPDEYLAKLFRDRRLLLETAAGKLGALAAILRRENLAKLRYTLIYATDKDPTQLEQVNDLLNREHVLFHQLTQEETGDRGRTKEILASFQTGDIQVLTAKRVLDEGVNVPQIERAFILASTTVERQWVQRRGRILRTCPAIGKTHGIIHDFIVVPPDTSNLDDDARALIKSELRRTQEFASLARNAGLPNGPLHIIHGLIQAVSG